MGLRIDASGVSPFALFESPEDRAVTSIVGEPGEGSSSLRSVVPELLHLYHIPEVSPEELDRLLLDEYVMFKAQNPPLSSPKDSLPEFELLSTRGYAIKNFSREPLSESAAKAPEFYIRQQWAIAKFHSFFERLSEVDPDHRTTKINDWLLTLAEDYKLGSGQLERLRGEEARYLNARRRLLEKVAEYPDLRSAVKDVLPENVRSQFLSTPYSVRMGSLALIVSSENGLLGDVYYGIAAHSDTVPVIVIANNKVYSVALSHEMHHVYHKQVYELSSEFNLPDMSPADALQSSCEFFKDEFVTWLIASPDPALSANTIFKGYRMRIDLAKKKLSPEDYAVVIAKYTTSVVRAFEAARALQDAGYSKSDIAFMFMYHPVELWPALATQILRYGPSAVPPDKLPIFSTEEDVKSQLEGLERTAYLKGLQV